MGEFIQFANVTLDEAYPVVWADCPIYDELGTPATCHIDHRRHLIEISPSVPVAELDNEISYATDCARQDFPQPVLKIPVVGDVD